MSTSDSKYLPELEDLKKQLEDPKILEIYRNTAVYIGSYESVQYLLQLLEVDSELKNS